MKSALVRRSPEAQADLAGLFDYLAAEVSAQFAEVVLRRLGSTADRLAQFPQLGRNRPELAGAPRTFAGPWPWVLIYEPLPDDAGILILRVLDGRRDIPAELD